MPLNSSCLAGDKVVRHERRRQLESVGGQRLRQGHERARVHLILVDGVDGADEVVIAAHHQEGVTVLHACTAVKALGGKGEVRPQPPGLAGQGEDLGGVDAAATRDHHLGGAVGVGDQAGHLIIVGGHRARGKGAPGLGDGVEHPAVAWSWEQINLFYRKTLMHMCAYVLVMSMMCVESTLTRL